MSKQVMCVKCDR